MSKKKKFININNYGCCGGRGGNGGNSSYDVYSIDERVCGEWIDGKPIYRKIIEGRLAEANGGHVFADLTELDIDRMVNIYGNFEDNATGQNMIQVTLSRSSM